MDAAVPVVGQKVARIDAEDLRIRESIRCSHHLLRLQDIFRLAGVGIVGELREHAADLCIWVHLVDDAGRLGRCHELVVHGLGNHLIEALSRETVLHESSRDEGMALDGVNLIEREPVLHLALPACHARTHEAGEEIDCLAGVPALIGKHEIKRRLVVRERDKWLDAVGAELGEHLVVEGKAFLIRYGIVGVWEDTAPGDGHAVDLEAHLCQKRDILFVVVVEVRTMALGIMSCVVGLCQGTLDLGCAHAGILCVVRDVGIEVLAYHIVYAPALAAFVPATLDLICSSRSSPEEAFGECLSHCFTPFFRP